jgi:hypothetical protein
MPRPSGLVKYSGSGGPLHVPSVPAMRQAVEIRSVKLDYQPKTPANLPDWIKTA